MPRISHGNFESILVCDVLTYYSGIFTREIKHDTRNSQKLQPAFPNVKEWSGFSQLTLFIEI